MRLQPSLSLTRSSTPKNLAMSTPNMDEMLLGQSWTSTFPSTLLPSIEPKAKPVRVDISTQIQAAQESMAHLDVYLKVLAWLNHNADQIHEFWYVDGTPNYNRVWTLVYLTIRNEMPLTLRTPSKTIQYYLGTEPLPGVANLLTYEQPDFNLMFITPPSSESDLGLDSLPTPKKRRNTQARKKTGRARGGKKSKDAATRALQFDELSYSLSEQLLPERP